MAEDDKRLRLMIESGNSDAIVKTIKTFENLAIEFKKQNEELRKENAELKEKLRKYEDGKAS